MGSTGELQCRIVFHRLLHPYKNTIMETLENVVLFACLVDGLSSCSGSLFSEWLKLTFYFTCQGPVPLIKLQQGHKYSTLTVYIIYILYTS